MATSRVAITEAELLDAIAEKAGKQGPDEARTVQELCEATGMKHVRVLAALKVFGKQGRLIVHRVHRAAIDGTLRPVPAYTVAPKKR